ncbi:MAG: hypothetical protein JNL97_11355, partial [Verrucomicrobiales bacterium]|nr:hypothetical protein [Verrucomicrobiales bacterium]
MTRPSWFFRLQSLGTCMLMLLHDAERVRAESGLPSLSYRLVELSALELSWTSSDERIVLETSGTIDDCIPWRSLPGTQLHVGDTHSVTVPISDNPAFFQLYRLPETNLPPRLCSVGSRTVTVGERLTFDVAAVDPNRSPIRFSASPLPPNSHFDAETGRFTFQPTPTELGVHAVTFGVTDGTSTDEETVGITVKPLALRFDLLDDGNLRLSWTNNPRGFVLEQSTVIDGSNAWSLATSSVTQSANRNQVDVRPSEANRFFRLRLQRVPPLFKPMPSSYALALGTDIRLDLEASDADGDTLTFASDDLSLPEGAKLDGLTGTFTWHPNPSQIGTNVLRFLVSDGLHVERQTVSVVVRDAPPDGITRLTGRILDTTDAVAGRERPVVGARVSLLRNTAFALSDANGRFVLSDIPSGKQVLDIDTSAASPAPDNSPYAAFREEIQLIPRTDNVVGRPFYLPRIDPSSLTMVNPEAVTTVRNTNLNVTLTIPAHSAKMNGKDYDGPITISLVPSALAPAALPEFLQPNVLITIQPVGVTYAVPAAISFPNTTGIK